MIKPDKNKQLSKAVTYLNCAENFAYSSTCIKNTTLLV